MATFSKFYAEKFGKTAKAIAAEIPAEAETVKVVKEETKPASEKKPATKAARATKQKV